jgi:hypothetical protein
MRKLILIAAMSLIATQAFAGGSRSLSLAATNPTEPAAAPATTQPATVPQATVTATTTPTTTPVATPPAPQVAPPTAATTEPVKTTVANKPKHRELSGEARLIRELHRHGIYW